MRRGTFTTAAKGLVAADAKTTYKEKAKSVRQLIGRLEKALQKHDKEFAGDEKDWGYVGDIGHVESGLKDIVEFLRG